MADVITGAGEVRAALSDPRLIVPPVPDVAAAGAPGVAWLRSHVARFSSGPEHGRRRAVATAHLERIDPAELRRRAFERVRAGTPVEDVAVDVLAGALGIAASAATVRAVGAAYLPPAEPDDAADRAVAELVEACGGTADEAAAARIAILVQACNATAGLIANALRRTGPGDAEEALAGTLRDDSPVRTTRRVADGAEVVLDIAAAGVPFGAGAHACPGREHALAIAAGALDARRV